MSGLTRLGIGGAFLLILSWMLRLPSGEERNAKDERQT
jgi:hypothetical protein